MSPPPDLGAAVAALPSARPDPAEPALADPTAAPARRGGLLRRRFLRSRLGVLGRHCSRC
jgi:hypothetical protein